MTTAHLDTGTPISMSMIIADRLMNIKGVVVYADPGHGVGVRFRDLNDDDREFISSEMQST